MTRERGRPRIFDIDDALDAAVDVFWRKGFLNASLNELTTAMGVNKPSLYAAYGDKESLYLKALDRYIGRHLAPHAQQLDQEPKGRLAIESCLRALVAMYADPARPGGCLIVNGAADCGGTAMPSEVELALQRALKANEALLKARLQRAKEDGELPAATDQDAMAAFFISMVAGMAVLAKTGAEQARLELVIDAAMTIWPARPTRRRPVAA